MNRHPDRATVATAAALLLAALALARVAATVLQHPPLEPQQPAATETYICATVDQDGRLRIATAAGQNIEPEKDGEQVGFADP